MAEDDYEDLSNAQLAQKLKEAGLGGIPVTPTTRKTLIKKLKAMGQGDASTSRVHTDEEDSPRSKSPGRSRKRNPSPARNKSPSRLNSSNSDRTTRDRSSPTRSTRRTTRQSFNNDDEESYSPDISTKSLDNSPRYRANHSNSSNQVPSLGINDAFARRMTAAGGSFSDSSPPSNDNYRSSFLSSASSPPFRSDFLREIVSGRASIHSRSAASTLPPSVSSTAASSNLSEVKESDDEDAGQPRTYTKFSQGRASKYAVTQSKSSTRGRTSTPSEGWRLFRSDSPASAALLIVFCLFFLVLAFTYINMHATDNSMIETLDLYYPLCSPPGPKVNCIGPENKELVIKMYAALAAVLRRKSSEASSCKSNSLFIEDSTLISSIVDEDHNLSFWLVENQLQSLKILLEANYAKLRIKPAREGIYVEATPPTFYCSILASLMNAAHWFFTLSAGFLLAGVIFICGRYWLQREARHREAVFKLVNHIVDIVSSKNQGNECFIPISHVRDQLIPPKDRSKMAKLWEDAVEVLDHDSRLRREVQQVDGEQFYVWRWVASSLTPNKKKVWQGQAFDTVEGSVNSLQCSPTPCLKIRHMFDADQEEGDEWVTTVVDAILEKCGKAKILHLVVDQQSKEGCVYMKCASQADAGIAYHALHGSWFASNLVTVRYIREARYLERFPDSAKCTKPLRPSNDKQSSLLMPVY